MFYCILYGVWFGGFGKGVLGVRCCILRHIIGHGVFIYVLVDSQLGGFVIFAISRVRVVFHFGDGGFSYMYHAAVSWFLQDGISWEIYIDLDRDYAYLVQRAIS